MSETTNSELTVQAAHDAALKDEQERAKVADKASTAAAPETNDVDPLSAEADASQDDVADVVVELDPDFDAGEGNVSVGVANYADLVLEPGQTYAVSPQHAELLLASPAVKVVE